MEKPGVDGLPDSIIAHQKILSKIPNRYHNFCQALRARFGSIDRLGGKSVVSGNNLESRLNPWVGASRACKDLNHFVKLVRKNIDVQGKANPPRRSTATIWFSLSFSTMTREDTPGFSHTVIPVECDRNRSDKT